MKKNRDDFTPKTKRALRRRAGNRCSNPDCRVPTDGPSDEGPEKVNNIGIAAHITASGAGARRYNKSLKPEDRRSVINGIWLCSNCANLIDNDEKTYTVALLHEWKKKAEEQAKREQGRKLPGEHDAVNTLSAALTGQSGTSLPSLMSNASKASSNYLESLDPRFIVKTSFHKDVTQYVIHPKQPVGFKVAVDHHYAREFSDKFNKFIKHGEDLVIDSSAVRFDGFLILEKLLEDMVGKIEFINLPRKNVIIRVQAVSPESTTEQFYDIVGKAVSGTESITVEGRGAAGILSVKIRIFIDRYRR